MFFSGSRLIKLSSILAAVFALGVLASATPEADAAPRVRIHKTGSKAGKYDMYFSYLDGKKDAMGGLKTEDIKVISRETREEFSLSDAALVTMTDSKRTVAVLFVVANYRAFNPKNTKSLVPISDFISKMRDVDTVGFMHYGESQQNVKFSTDLGAVSRKVERIPKGEESIPKVFDAMRAGARRFSKEFTSQVPDRMYMVIITDGHGPWEGAIDTDKKVSRNITRLAKDLSEQHITPLIIGFDPNSGPDEPSLDRMREFAEESNGTFRLAADTEELASAVELAYKEIYGSYFFAFESSDFKEGESVKVQLQAKNTKSSTVTFSVPKLTEEPSSGMSWWWWVLIVFGAIVGLLFLIGLINFLRNRGAEEEYIDEEYQQDPYGQQHYPPQEYYPPAPIEDETPGAYHVDDSPPARFFAVLYGQNGPYSDKCLYIVEETTTFGSVPGNTVILKHGTISKKHAGIRIKDGSRFELHDFGSTNGVYVNDNRVSKQFLKNGDRVRFGRLEFTFKLE